MKTTIAVQALAALALLWRCLSGGLRRQDLLLAYPLLLLLVMSTGKIQLGMRYLLPAFPFVMLWLAMTLAPLRRVSFAVLGFGALSLLLIHPDELMFFNAWSGGPDQGGKALVQGSDWCQDRSALGRWQRDNQVNDLRYSGCGLHEAGWGIAAEHASCSAEAGTYAIQLSEMFSPIHNRPHCFDWLMKEPPDARLGHSIWLWRVDGARAARLAAP